MRYTAEEKPRIGMDEIYAHLTKNLIRLRQKFFPCPCLCQPDSEPCRFWRATDSSVFFCKKSAPSHERARFAFLYRIIRL